MNIEHKKTTLDDDSILYQKRDDSLGKKDISNLSRGKKLGYFKDYYLKIVIIAVIAAAIVIALLNTMIFNRKESVFSIVFLNESYLNDSEEFSDALTQYLGLTDSADYISVSNYDLDQYQVQMAYVTQMTAGGIDVVVCPLDYFEEGSKLGVFADLSEVLPDDMYHSLSDRILESREAVTDNYGEVVSWEDPLPHGIDLTGNARYEEFDGYDEKPILCVLKNAVHMENSLRLISWFTDVPYVPSEEAAPVK